MTTKEALDKIVAEKKFDKALRWLAQGYKDGEEPKVCPKCGMKLIKRTGPAGVFLACSNPECKYAEESE